LSHGWRWPRCTVASFMLHQVVFFRTARQPVHVAPAPFAHSGAELAVTTPVWPSVHQPGKSAVYAAAADVVQAKNVSVAIIHPASGHHTGVGVVDRQLVVAPPTSTTRPSMLKRRACRCGDTKRIMRCCAVYLLGHAVAAHENAKDTDNFLSRRCDR
jgi:hypothetical protein